MEHLRAHTSTLQSKLEELEAILNANDMDTLVRRQAHLTAAIQEFHAVSFVILLTLTHVLVKIMLLILLLCLANNGNKRQCR